MWFYSHVVWTDLCNSVLPRSVPIVAEGFYSTGNGKITKAYLEALRENGLKPVLGENASQQPGNIQEILLHA